MSPLGFLGRDLAVDLGAATTQIYAPGRGIVLNEPSAALTATGRTLFGAPAYESGGGIARWPVREGGELAGRLIKYFLTKVHGHPFARPRLVMALPDGSSPLLRAAARDLAYRADARRIYLVEHAVAVALGAGLPVREPMGRMIVDIGPRLTRIAILTCGAVVAATTVHAGGDAVNRAIAALAACELGLLVGEAEAEAVKLRAGSRWKPIDRHVIVRGLDPESRRERIAWLPVQQLYEVTRAPAEAIARAAASALERCPAELAGDVAAHGVVLTGGGALLRGLARRLRTAMGVPARRADRPVESMALGLGRYADRLSAIGPRPPL
ncbi:rod shape-determining protein [Nonomuraea sp. MCN248]|uniref:Rod shape-determining protein n=1 Tax=Nonomuraea corallina TaxID=2989783 RepID=A0ABT4SH02_9ACTN|nr:rod shape-determining protein [Nonomuraea corallina]MDA0636496.1 rod shape-determining protein [Nonomuraea corallina]